MLTIKATLPPKGAGDVKTSEVELSITNPDGTVLSPATVFVDRDTQNDFTFSVVANAEVLATQTDVDGSGNRSTPTKTGPFKATDTFPPPAPGQLGFEVIGQDD